VDEIILWLSGLWFGTVPTTIQTDSNGVYWSWCLKVATIICKKRLEIYPCNKSFILPKDNGNHIIGAGCMAALDAEHYLQGMGLQEGERD